MTQLCRRIVRVNLPWRVVERVSIFRDFFRFIWERILVCSAGRTGAARYRRLPRRGNSLSGMEALEGPATACGEQETDSDLVSLKISLLGDCQIGKTSFVVSKMAFLIFTRSDPFLLCFKEEYKNLFLFSFLDFSSESRLLVIFLNFSSTFVFLVFSCYSSIGWYCFSVILAHNMRWILMQSPATSSWQIKYVGDEQEKCSLQMTGLNLMDKTMFVQGARISCSIWDVAGKLSNFFFSWGINSERWFLIFSDSFGVKYLILYFLLEMGSLFSNCRRQQLRGSSAHSL